MYSGTIVGTNEGGKKPFRVTLGYIVTYVSKYTPAFMDDVYKKYCVTIPMSCLT